MAQPQGFGSWLPYDIAPSSSEQSAQSADTTSLPSSSPGQDTGPVPRDVRHRLYTSHFLSTWNSRVFEFGAILYLANIFPSTLLPVSVYALVRGAAAVLLSPAVGHYVDVGNRLQVVRLSIVAQRSVVAASCTLFYLLSTDISQSTPLTAVMLVLLTVLACLEKLCSIMNLVAVERDWVVIIAAGDESSLRLMNSQMRRIDLFCKLAGPFTISIIDGFSTPIAILVNTAMNILSLAIEYYAIAHVHSEIQELQQPKTFQLEPSSDPLTTTLQRLRTSVSRQTKELSWYFHHRAFRASFACCLLYFNVLSFGGQMTTYLLSAGYNSFHIAITRTASVTFEISATWLAPWVMARIGPVRGASWFINWQMLCLSGAVALFWLVKLPLVAATGLVAGTILSRIGLWGFDLSTQIIVQDEVDAEHRGSFSAIEASWQNLFELCSYATTIMASKPGQFRWPVLVSVAAVYAAGVLYASFVRDRRGHLIHVSKCIEGARKTRRPLHDDYIRLEAM